MDSSQSSPICPGCRRPIAPGRALGLCPRCLLARVAMPTEPGTAGVASGQVPDLDAVTAAFPQLEILEQIGRGGMGVVYRVRQKSLGRIVALKLLAPGRERDPAFAERFAREARALAVLNHPGIVTVHDFGFTTSGPGPGLYYLLMEYVDGVNLRQAMKAGRFTPEQALAVVPPVCAALQFAHEHGIVHRDIKPENLLIDKEGRIKIADFGIARMLDEATVPESMAGTPQYMAPEQRDPGVQADHRADIYSLGVVLYELLTGELPGALLEPPSCKVELDVRLDAIVLRALAVNPELRYGTAEEFKTRVSTIAGIPAGAAEVSNPKDPMKQPPRILRTGGGLLHTGEQLGSFQGQYFIWKHRGRLQLDDQKITFEIHGETRFIPLGAIGDISISTYPLTMNPVGLDVLCVTYSDASGEHRIFLSPMERWFEWPSTWNARVSDWASAIRNAAKNLTGREPAKTPGNRVWVPDGGFPTLLLTVMVLTGPLIGSHMLFNALSSGSGYSPTGRWVGIVVMLLSAGSVIPFLAGRNKKQGDHYPPDSRPKNMGASIGALGLLIFSSLVMVSFGSCDRPIGRARAKDIWPAPKRNQLASQGAMSKMDRSIQLSWTVKAGSSGRLHVIFGTNTSTTTISRQTAVNIGLEVSRLDAGQMRTQISLPGGNLKWTVPGDFETLAAELQSSMREMDYGDLPHGITLCKMGGEPLEVMLITDPAGPNGGSKGIPLIGILGIGGFIFLALLGLLTLGIVRAIRRGRPTLAIVAGFLLVCFLVLVLAVAAWVGWYMPRSNVSSAPPASVLGFHPDSQSP